MFFLHTNYWFVIRELISQTSFLPVPEHGLVPRPINHMCQKNGFLLDLLRGTTANPAQATQEGIRVQGQESWQSEASHKRRTGRQRFYQI